MLSRLGLEDCFERIISFETLNSSNKGTVPANKYVAESGKAELHTTSSPETFDIDEFSSHPNADLDLPKTPVVCKPFEEAFQQVFKIANITPVKTVR